MGSLDRALIVDEDCLAERREFVPAHRVRMARWNPKFVFEHELAFAHFVVFARTRLVLQRCQLFWLVPLTWS